MHHLKGIEHWGWVSCKPGGSLGSNPYLTLIHISDRDSQEAGGKAPGLDKIHPKMLGALDNVGLSWTGAVPVR